MKAVSIIIPVHNSAEYMRKCLDSCINQTLPNIEVIAVDDCSNDNSRDILAEYEERYKGKFKSMALEKNMREGGARNAAICKAEGEYVLFVDSDDWIDLDACEKLYSASEGADLVGGDYYISTDDEDREVHLEYANVKKGEMTPQAVFEYIKSNSVFATRLYKREMLIKNDIYFPECICYPDLWFNTMVAFYADGIIKISKCFYHYYQHQTSIVHSRNKDYQYDRLFSTNLLWDSMKERGLLDKYGEIAVWKYLNMMASGILYTCLGSFDKPSKKRIAAVCDDIKKRIPKFKSTDAFKTMNSELKLYLKLSMIHPGLAIIVYKSHVYDYFQILNRKLSK